MAADLLLILACAGAVGGSLALRHAWGLSRRSPAWDLVGWGLYLAAASFGWTAAGAWGTSIACIAGIGAALLILARAGLASPASAEPRASNRRVGALPGHGEPWRIGRRIATFLIVTIAAMVVAVGLSLAVRALLIAAHAGEANATVAAFYAMPLAWAVLTVLLLMEKRRARQFRLLAATAIPGLIAVLGGWPS